MLRPTRAVAAVLIAIALSACGDDGNNDTQAADCNEGDGASVMVEIPDFEFSPTPVQVNACDEVVWSNTHTQPHTSTSNGDKSWSTGNIAVGGQGEPVRFDTPGSYAYMCALHPFMKGTVEVS